MIVDLLVNMETADGELEEPAALMRAAKAAGLDGMVLTRAGELHPDLEPFREEAEATGLLLFSGAEVETSHGVILVLVPRGEGLAEDFAPREDEVYDAHAVIDVVEAAGGATVALRPYDRSLAHPMGDHLFSLQGLDACEVINGRLAEVANDLALEAASHLEMPCVGSSNAKGVDGLGSAATLLRVPVTDETGLIALLKRGDCWPLSFSDELPKEARAERGARPDRRRKEGSSGRRPANRGGAPRAEPRRERGGEPREAAGRRRAKGRSGGRRGSGPTRVTSAPDHADRLPDDVGNRVRQHEPESSLPDDIGNRLAPGETSPFHDATRREPSGEEE